MTKQDQEIKAALRRKQSTIDDPFFTQKIVSRHIEKMNSYATVHQVDFGSLLTGLIAVLCSFTIAYLNSIFDLGLSKDQLSVMQIIPVLYLVFQLMNEYLFQKGSFNIRLSLFSKGLFIGLIGLSALF